MRPYELYVALGDSMSTDDYPGPGLGAAALLYRNRDDVHPEFAGRDLHSLNPSTRFLPLAQDGGTTASVLSQIRELKPHRGPVLVTLTVGGNDFIHFMNLGMPLHQAAAEFRGNLDSLLERLRGLFPDDLTLRLGTIYDPTDGTGRVQSGHERFAAGLPILGQVNDLIADTARRHGGDAVDIHGHFLGHGLRHADPTYDRHDPTDPSGWIMLDIEPNPRGASEIRRLFWRSLP